MVDFDQKSEALTPPDERVCWNAKPNDSTSISDPAIDVQSPNRKIAISVMAKSCASDAKKCRPITLDSTRSSRSTSRRKIEKSRFLTPKSSVLPLPRIVRPPPQFRPHPAIDAQGQNRKIAISDTEGLRPAGAPNCPPPAPVSAPSRDRRPGAKSKNRDF